ncbi:hypothetical protein [Actinomadura sediminis]|uniref:SaeA fourth Fn3-like domain-containing protein n=1 Tax=Actinomadura sediminis TaxID=1038904 RepID=A0ABW3EXG2_9ACTN
MTFDEEYRRDVLEPARASGDQPPEDLRVRYALPDPLEPDAVTARVREVRQCWRRARGQLKYRRLIDRLEAEHRTLAPLFAAAERGDLRGLAERLHGGTERAERRRAGTRARLVDAAGAPRMATPGEVAAIARAGGMAADELARLAAADGIEVREPDPLPAAPPYPAFRKVRESLDVLGERHLAGFLFGDRPIGPMHVLDGFALSPPGGGADRAPRPAPAAVAAAGERWARRARDTSTTHAETVLAALRSVADPAELLRYDIVDRLRERFRQLASDRGLLRHAAEDLGVAAGDARRLVFLDLREDGPDAAGGRGGVAGRLRALLDAGEVFAAAELADASDVPAPDGGGDPPEERLLAAEARRRLDTALRLRETAAAERDPDRAWRLLADALRLVRDLPGAAEHQRRLPPAPVPSVRADVEYGDGHAGGAVRVSWEPSPSTAGEVLYHVVRRRGRPPRGPADGRPVRGGLDPEPPVNAPLYYGVVAVRGEAAAPPAVAGPVVVRPEPSGVELVPGDGRVTGRWRAPAEAARILVVRDGTVVPAGRDGFGERVPNGRAHVYRISAVYLDGDGREVVTPGVRAAVTPSAPPDPVMELAAEPDPGDPGLVRVRFAPPANGRAELVLADGEPPWPRSALVPLEEVRRATRRVPETAGSAPGEGRLAVRPGAGGWLVAVTVAEGTAAIGAAHRHVNLPPPRRVVAERRGGHVHVGFDWPRDVTEIELVHRVAGAAPERAAVSRAAYDAHGGVRVPAPEDAAVEVTLASAGTVGGARTTGPPVTAAVAARTVVRYDVVRSGPPWRRSLTIRLTASRPVRVGRLSLVLRPGRVMPRRAGDGETLRAWEQVPVPGELSAPAPHAAGPYWLRCFTADDDVELADPPVDRLRVRR